MSPATARLRRGHPRRSALRDEDDLEGHQEGPARVASTPGTTVTASTLTAKLGKATIGKIERPHSPPELRRETVKLSKAGKSKLGKKSSAKVSVTAEIPFGAPATAKAKLK